MTATIFTRSNNSWALRSSRFLHPLTRVSMFTTIQRISPAHCLLQHSLPSRTHPLHLPTTTPPTRTVSISSLDGHKISSMAFRSNTTTKGEVDFEVEVVVRVYVGVEAIRLQLHLWVKPPSSLWARVRSKGVFCFCVSASYLLFGVMNGLRHAKCASWEFHHGRLIRSRCLPDLYNSVRTVPPFLGGVFWIQQTAGRLAAHC
jgi:hypothetical protein